MTTPPTPQIFDGLRVVDLTSGMAGPLASMMLADHGADVVKVEPPGGDWTRGLPAFGLWNRGKRSVCIDMADANDRALLRDLIDTADVLIATDVAAVLRRLDVSPEHRAARNPGLVTCSISGFGPEQTPDTTRPYEGIVAASTGRMTGLNVLSGAQPAVSDECPTFTAAPVASFGASQLAVHGVVAALLQRQRTGVGQDVATSLLEGAIAFVMRQELSRESDAASAGISPATHRGIELCFLTAECADGRFVQMCARQDRHFREWLRALDMEDVLDEPRYQGAPMGITTVADVDELEVRLRARMKTRTQSEWMRIFAEEYDVGADPFLTPDEFLAHPDMVDNGRVVELTDRALGAVRQVGPLVQMSATPARIDRPAPELGDANQQVLSGDRWAAPQRSLPAPVEDPNERRAPLTGTTILEVAYFIAGPLASALLAELGARVIKVEPLEGDPYRRTGLQSAKFLHGKESITLDLKQPAGRDVLERLIERSDVVVHSFRSAAATKLGLDAETVLGQKPTVVHLYAASYGSNGPQRDRAAFHSTPNALSGGGIKQAGLGNPPVNDSYADPGSALGAATAVLFGLWARESVGVGQALETTMLTSTAYIHSADMVVYDGSQMMVADSDQRGLCAGYRLYECADGWVFVAALQPAEWRALLAALELPEWDDADDRRAAEALSAALADRTVADATQRLTAVGVGATPVYGGEFDQWLEQHGMLDPMEHSLFGRYWRLPTKIRLSGSDPVRRPACAAGEQSRAILEELGFTAEAITALIASEVTTQP